MVITLTVAAGLILVLVFVIRSPKSVNVPPRAKDYACQVFQLPLARTRFLNLDMANVKGSPYYFKGIVGVPDCVCTSQWRGSPVTIVGEAKGRKSYNKPRKFEVYQLQMYMAMVADKHRGKIIGLLAYKDGVIEVPYSKEIVQEMLSQRRACKAFLSQY
jgi:hypothetical protein